MIRFDKQALVKTLVDEYLAEEKASGVADAALMDLRSRLRKFGHRFGERKVHEITIDEVKDWHTDMATIEGLDPQSRRHYLNKASQFYKWCIRNKKCGENPVAVVKRPKVVTREIEFYSVDQCKTMLRQSGQYGLFHYVVLGLIPAIRPRELLRLGEGHIRVGRRIITLGADVTKKTRRRIIELREGDPLGDCLMAWLTSSPLPPRVFAGNLSTFKRHFRKFRDAIAKEGVVWIQDGLRHTGASYHYAFYEDVAKTAKLLGDHNHRVILEHYAGLAIKAEAEQFYALRPADSNGDSTAIGKDASVSGTPGGI